MPRPSPLLPPDAVTVLDGLLGNHRIDTCRVQTKTITVDRGGAQVETWGAVGSPISCRVTPANRALQEGIRGGRVTPEADVEIRFHRDVIIERDNRIHHAESGQVFDVLANPNLATIGLELIVSAKDNDG